MSIDQASVVDAIGVDNATGNAVLTIGDHLPWNKEHLLLLQEKLNTYLAFVENGELISNYPDAKDRNVQINIVCKYTPNEEAVGFLNKVQSIVEGAGIKFTYQIFKAN